MYYGLIVCSLCHLAWVDQRNHLLAHHITAVLGVQISAACMGVALLDH